MSHLTPRQNLLAVLRHQEPESIPVIPTFDNFNYPAGSQPDLVKTGDFVTLARRYGRPVIDRASAGSPVKAIHPNVQVREEIVGDTTTRITETPIGLLTERWRRSVEGQTNFRYENALKGPADYRIYRFILGDTHFEIGDQELITVHSHVLAMGEEGIVYVVAPETPMMHLFRVMADPEQVIYGLLDEDAEVMETIEMLAARNYEHYELLASTTPTEAIVSWEDTEVGLVSPPMFQRFAWPVLARYAEICHDHGKIFVDHMCGKIRAFLPMIRTTGIDALDWLAPPPTGDTPFAEARQAWGEAITIMGTVDPSILRFGSVEAVQRHVRSLLQGMGKGDNFVLMVPPPMGTPAANLQAVFDLMQTEGCYPLHSKPTV